MLVESNTSLFTVDDHIVYLNPFGEFLFSREQYRATLKTKILISEAVQRILDTRPIAEALRSSANWKKYKEHMKAHHQTDIEAELHIRSFLR